eukprot:m.164729 g.164729  ORF g.164729 m.164729 type:complete len:65 (-) comp16587_c0_seq1:742-936(-)
MLPAESSCQPNRKIIATNSFSLPKPYLSAVSLDLGSAATYAATAASTTIANNVCLKGINNLGQR